MLNLTELKNRKKETADKMCQIAEANGEFMTEDSQERFNALATENAKLDMQIDMTEKALLAQQQADLQLNRPAPSIGRQTKADSIPGSIPASPKKNYNSLRVYSGKPEKAYGLAMWAMASVLKNPQAIGWCNKNGIDLYATSQSEGTNLLGGHLVPDMFSNEIIDLRNEYGVFRRNTRVVTMTSETLTIPKRVTGLTGYWTGEGNAITESNKTWGAVQVVLKKLACIARMSKELTEDAIIPVGDDLADEIAYALAYGEDVAGFVGTGGSTHGHIVGACMALKTAAGNPTTTSAGGVIVAAGNTFAEFTLPNLTALIGRVLPRALKRAKWFCHPVVYSDVMLRLLYAAGGLSASDIAGGVQQSFLGYPVELCAAMPSTDVNSQISILFGDLGLSSTMGDRNGISLELSGDAVVGGESTFERDQVAIRGRERVDIVNHDYGNTSTGGPVVGVQSLNS